VSAGTGNGGAGEGELLAAEAAFAARLERYRELGHDREAAVRWVVDAAGPLTGPVLDIGTGKGLLAVELARRGLAVTSVDPCRPDQLLAARRAARAGCAATIRLVHGTVDAVEPPPGGFGSAAMMNVLHHLGVADGLVRRLGELVRPGGRLAVAEFTDDGFAVVAAAHRAEGRVHAVGPVTTATMRACLAEHGWRVVREATGHLHEVVVVERE